MKKLVKFLSLTLVIVMLLSSVAFAVSNDRVEVTPQTITTIEGCGITATLEEVKTATGVDDVINVTVSGTGIVAGEQYLVVMVKPDANGEYTIQKDAILYIDQTASEAGTFSFRVYPSSMSDSAILITNQTTGTLVAAIVDAKYIIGDANEDGKVSGLDIVRIANYLVGAASINADAADANADGKVSGLDIVRIANYLVGNATLG